MSVFWKSLLPISWEDIGKDQCGALHKIYLEVT